MLGKQGGINFTVVDNEQQILASSGKAGKTGSGAVTFRREAGKERMEKDDSSVLICRENICGPLEAVGPSSFPLFASDFVQNATKVLFGSVALQCFNREVIVPLKVHEHKALELLLPNQIRC